MVRGEETVIATVGSVSLSLDPIIGDWAVTVIVAVVAALATWGSTKLQHRAKPEHALIDQLQETMRDRDEFYKGQIAEIKQTAQDAQDRAKRAEHKATRNERMNISLFGYANVLRNHIEMRYGPPAPDWPPEVTGDGSHAAQEG